MMNTMQMRKVLADKLKAEQSGLGWASISLTRQPEEHDDDIAVYEIVMQGYEHIKFRIHLSVSKYFGNEVWASERWYNGDEEVENHIVATEDSKKLSHETLLRDVLIKIGYRIANTF